MDPNDNLKTIKDLKKPLAKLLNVGPNPELDIYLQNYLVIDSTDVDVIEKDDTIVVKHRITDTDNRFVHIFTISFKYISIDSSNDLVDITANVMETEPKAQNVCVVPDLEGPHSRRCSSALRRAAKDWPH